MFKKILTRLFSVGSMGFIISCAYGLPSDYRVERTIRVESEEGIPIQGLEMTLRQNLLVKGSQYTDIAGLAYFEIETDFPANFLVDIHDSDGFEHLGDFKDTTFNLPENTEYIEITLKRKE